MEASMLDVAGLHHEYTQGTVAIDDIGFGVRQGEVVSIVGPSGCGKTTLLRCISGLQEPTRGDVRLLGVPVDGVPDDLAMVFQDYSRSLFPWLKVGANVAFPLQYRKIDAAERDRRVDESLEAVGLSDARGKFPWQLSGGMQQRVAIARALAYRPKLMLMDEPFASVDAQTRSDLEDLVLDVRRRYDMTMLVVTHDIDEAVYLADRVVVLSRSPSRVVSVVDVELPPERDQIETKSAPGFVELRRQVAQLIRRPEAAAVA
jgi:NitT/TauT family transport system ATP-binding protein